MIKNILFDLGGVLVDLDRDEAVRRFHALGVTDADEQLDAYEQKGIFRGLEDGTLTASEFEKALTERYGGTFTHEAVYHAVMEFFRNVPLYKYAYLDELRNRYRLFILSNTNPYIMEHTESEHFLPDGRRLSSYVEKVFASYRYKAMKPSPAFFNAIVAESGILPEESLFIDDGVANTQAAQKLGFNVLWVENASDWRNTLTRFLTDKATKNNTK